MTSHTNNLAWLHLETTGGVPEHTAILEFGLALTNYRLQDLDAPIALAIWQPAALLNAMAPGDYRRHATSGLLNAVTASEIGLQDAEREALRRLTACCAPGTAILCGENLTHGRALLRRHMPLLDNYLGPDTMDVGMLRRMAAWAGWPSYEPAEGPALSAGAYLDDLRSETRFLLRHARECREPSWAVT